MSRRGHPALEASAAANKQPVRYGFIGWARLNRRVVPESGTRRSGYESVEGVEHVWVCVGKGGTRRPEQDGINQVHVVPRCCSCGLVATIRLSHLYRRQFSSLSLPWRAIQQSRPTCVLFGVTLGKLQDPTIQTIIWTAYRGRYHPVKVAAASRMDATMASGKTKNFNVRNPGEAPAFGYWLLPL